MTMTEKILAQAAQKTTVTPGEYHWCKVDRMFTHDPCAPGVLGIFEREFGPEASVFDPDRIALIPDHFIFTTDPLANRNIEQMRVFAKKKGITQFYDPYSPSYKGVCHLALIEAGMVQPGELLVGTDSHTPTAGAFGCFAIGVGNTDAAYAMGTAEVLLKIPPTIRVEIEGELPPFVQSKDLILFLLSQLGVNGANYQVLEFGGPTIEAMGAEQRMTICNMSVEAGAKAAMMAPNQAALDYLARWSLPVRRPVFSDQGAVYQKVIRLDVSKLTPQVAQPFSPDRGVPVKDCEGEPVSQVYLGSCTGGKFEDFLDFAKWVKGKKVRIQTFAVPGTAEIQAQLIQHQLDGVSLHQILIEAGVKLSSNPGCGACCGGPLDTFGRVNEPITVLSTTNRNFPGRMGHKEARIYLGSSYTAAATALNGALTDPSRFFVNQEKP